MLDTEEWKKQRKNGLNRHKYIHIKIRKKYLHCYSPHFANRMHDNWYSTDTTGNNWSTFIYISCIFSSQQVLWPVK